MSFFPGSFPSVRGLICDVSHKPTEITVLNSVEKVDAKEYWPTDYLPERLNSGKQIDRLSRHTEHQPGICIKPND